MTDEQKPLRDVIYVVMDKAFKAMSPEQIRSLTRDYRIESWRRR